MFSIIIRSAFPEEDFNSPYPFHPSIILENLYLSVLFFIVIWSTVLKVESAEYYLKISVILMGIMSLILAAFTFLFILRSTGIDKLLDDSYLNSHQLVAYFVVFC